MAKVTKIQKKKVTQNWRAKKKMNSYDRVALALKEQEAIKQLEDLIKTKNDLSLLGELIVYENLISYKLVHLTILTQQRINKSIKSQKLHIKVSEFEDLLRGTLGWLIALYENISPKSKYLINRLNNFNNGRTNLTHHMHIGYTDTKQIMSEAKKVCKLGREILNRLDINIKGLTPEFKVRIPKKLVINLQELMEDQIERENATLPNPMFGIKGKPKK